MISPSSCCERGSMRRATPSSSCNFINCSRSASVSMVAPFNCRNECRGSFCHQLGSETCDFYVAGSRGGHGAVDDLVGPLQKVVRTIRWIDHHEAAAGEAHAGVVGMHGKIGIQHLRNLQSLEAC